MRSMLVIMLLALATTALAQDGERARARNTSIELDDGTRMTYGIATPAGYDADPETPRPLVLALHPGGSAPAYGTNFMINIVEPALRGWNAIMVAPDVPARRWNDERSEAAVLALIDDVRATHAIDPARILVTGFSMGGAGTWYFATRHADLFTGAIAIAARQGDASLDGLGDMPIHLIHSPSDEVVPYAPAVESARALEERGHAVRLTTVEGAGHYNMGNYVAPLRDAGEWMLEQWDGGQ